ncbi:MAG: Gldg family protein [Candidatus Kerfeldbacteria bacterium]|nr:Gldg family protein [Candidatus Kerfeldbacteria bacterium]
MKNTLALFKKEFQSYFHSLLSYLFIVVFLVVLSWLFWQNLFLVGQTTMRDFFSLLPWFFLFLLPALTMRLWSEEKKLGTMETLLTLPISDAQAVLAKFFAAASFVALVLLFSLPLPITLASIGHLDWGPVIGAYIGAWLLGCSYIALGQWVSSLTKNQIVAFLITIVAGFIFLLFGMSFFTNSGGILSKVFYLLSTQTHFQNLAKGVIDLRDIVYYFSFIGIFLFINTKSIDKQRKSIHAYSQTVLVVAIAVVVNMLMMSLSVRFDMTEGKQYTLSDATKNIVSRLQDPVTIKVFFSKEVPQDLLALKRDVEDLTSEYKRAGGGNVIVEFTDPKADSAAQKEVSTYGIPQIQFNVVGNEKYEVSNGYAGIALVHGDQYETIPVVSQTTNLEYDMTAAIQKMSREQVPQISFLSDHGVETTGQVQKALEQQYSVNAVTLDDLSNVQNLVIVGPTEAFTDKEQYTLDQFVMNGGKLFVLLDGMVVNEQYGQVQPNTTGLEKLLGKYGVTVEQNLVADFESPQTLQFGNGPYRVLQPYPLWPKIVSSGLNSENPITGNISELALPWPSEVTIQTPQGATATDLVKTSAHAYAFTDLQSITPDAITTPANDALGQHVLGALLSGSLSSAYANVDKPADVDTVNFKDHVDNAELFVMGNSKFVADDLLQGSTDNALILNNAIDALTQDVSLITIRSRNSLNRPIKTLSDGKKVAIKYTNIFSSVIIVLVVSGATFIIRRRKDHKAKELYA